MKYFLLRLGFLITRSKMRFRVKKRNFQILFKLRKKIVFDNITLRYIIIRENQLSFIAIIAYHVFCDANPRKCNSELIV